MLYIMSFFNKVQAAAAEGLAQRLQDYKEKQKLDVPTSEEQDFINKVVAICKYKGPKIIDTAYHGKKYVELYNGDFPVSFGHLCESAFDRITKDMCIEINAHYGKEFKVTYSDERMGGFANGRGKAATIAINWHGY